MATATVETFQDKTEWLASRTTGIGSSDAPVILGLSPWKSPLALYHEKRGLRDESDGETEYREWGLALEPAIIAGYERVTHRAVGGPLAALGHYTNVASRYTLARDADLPFLVASPDASVLPVLADSDGDVVVPPVCDAPGVLEVKNVDISKGREWMDAQEPPLIYLVQVQHQLMVTGAAWGSIAALVGGNKFLWADVPRDDEFIAQLRQRAIAFWNGVLAGEPPPVDGSDSTRTLLGRLYPRDTGEVVELPADLREWDLKRDEAIQAEKAAAAVKQEAENHIRAAIGDATMGVLPGGVSYSWKWQTRKEHVVKASEFRVLRRKGARGEE